MFSKRGSNHIIPFSSRVVITLTERKGEQGTLKAKQNYIPYSELGKKAKEENAKSKEIFESRLNPNVKYITEDGNGKKVHYLRDASEPATLEMIQYYYHLGNIYTDGVDTKANISIACSIISAIVSITAIIVSLI